MVRCPFFLSPLLLFSAMPGAWAGEIAHEGLVFSDELGSFRLLSVTGAGSVDDPMIITEEVTGPEDPVLIIRGMSAGFDNRIGSQHAVALAVRKIVVNRTDKTWHNYQMELRETPSRHSPYSDGLSFGQNSETALSYTKSSFPDVQRFDEPEDTLGFSGAMVAPGESAFFDFVISDTSPVPEFYLYQEPLQPISMQNETLGQTAAAGLSSGIRKDRMLYSKKGMNDVRQHFR